MWQKMSRNGACGSEEEGKEGNVVCDGMRL